MKKTYYSWIFLFLFLPLSGNSQDLTKKELKRVVNEISELLAKNYVIAEQRASLLAKFEKETQSDDFFNVTNPDSLAKMLTKRLQKISNDKHLYVQHLKSDHIENEFDWEVWAKEERILEKKLNFGFTQAQIIEGNIGYLKIVEFMHPHRGMQTAVSAMKFMENTDGTIIDLRGNGGGYDGLMEYILNHYFDGPPTHISTTVYSEKDSRQNENYTSDLVYGKLRVDTPLYVIIDGETGSAAEFFAYTLQSFGKARVVGQPSAGAAHRNSYFPLSNNFRISISTAAPINPITKTNWERSGVQPDFLVELEDAKDRTIELIREDLEKIK